VSLSIIDQTSRLGRLVVLDRISDDDALQLFVAERLNKTAIRLFHGILGHHRHQDTPFESVGSQAIEQPFAFSHGILGHHRLETPRH